MVDLSLKSIEIHNWMTIKSARIEFPEKGLVLVIGSNLAADGKLASVGAGKSAIGEALSRALLGVAGRYTHLGYFLSDTCKSGLYVKVEATMLKKPLVVELGFKCKEMVSDGEALRFTYGDEEPFQGARVEQTRAGLQRMLQVTPELADWTAFIDGDRLKFNKMSQEASVNLLMTSLAQPPWTEYFKHAAKKLQAASRQVELSGQTLTNSNRDVEDATADLKDAQEDHRDAQEDYKRQVDDLDAKIAGVKTQIGAERVAVTVAEARMVEIKKQIKLLEEQHAAQNHKLEIERGALRDALATQEQPWLKAGQAVSQLEVQVNEAQGVVTTMQAVPKTCPTCGKPWDKAHGEQEIAKAQNKADALKAGLEAAKTAYAARQIERRGLKQKLAELEDRLNDEGQKEDVQDLGDEYGRNEKMARNLGAMIHQRELNLVSLQQGVDVGFVNKKLAVVEERQRALQKATSAVKEAAANLAVDEEVLKVAQYWHKAFGPTGIPNMILADAVPMLNRVAQRISNLMTGGTLQITYSTTRDLVSGESRSALVTKIINRIGSKRLEGSSKGEGGLTNLMIAENLSELGQVSNRIGFRFYDEITSGQDATVRRSIFAYLKEVANRMGILIFVVDHHPEASSYADFVLLATKTKESGTVYSWQ